MIMENSQQSEGRPGAILVVDDMEMVLSMVGLLLRKFGYTVHLAGSAKDGLRVLETEVVDLILTDVMMPECDGITLLKEIRQRTQDVPVVLMTGSAHLEMAMEAMKNGAFDLITKPLDGQYLRKIVEKALEHRRLLSVERNYYYELERTVAEQTMQLKEALLELDKFHQLAKSSSEERSQFLSTLTHELRTPMNGIVGPLSMLGESKLSGDDRELVEIASISAGRMTQLVDQLLSFAESRHNRNHADKSRFDLRQLTDSLAKAHRAAFAAKGIVLAFSVEPEVPENVLGDRELTGKIAEILLTNALKFTDRGLTSLSVCMARDADGQPTVSLRVTDTGIGIPPEKLERIFEPFFQVDGGLTRRQGGLGLGLSLARQIAQHLGGSIRVESEPGSGCSFQVDLPFFG